MVDFKAEKSFCNTVRVRLVLSFGEVDLGMLRVGLLHTRTQILRTMFSILLLQKVGSQK